MSWQFWVRSVETVLESSRMLTSLEIISLIKRVNPTRLQLSETEREQGYRIKNRLQNLLLENYGEVFYLAPHPCRPDIILIKHTALPSIDACHADLNALSPRALATVSDLAAPPTECPEKRQTKGKSRKAAGGCSPKEVLENAQLLLEQYEYPQAEEMLATLRISAPRDLPVLVKAAGMLVQEVGAYQRAIELLLAQPRELLKDKAVREILAQSYYGNGMIPEARAVFDATYPADLGKSALYAYADISFKDGNLSQAFHLLKLSEEKEGFVTAHASLRREIEAAMLDEARPYLQQGEAAFAGGDLTRAESLLQQALALYPNFQEARRLAGAINAEKSKAEIALLWAQFEASGTAEHRLALLAQLCEQDKENSGRVRDLAARERERQKQEAVQDRLQTLETLAARESWEPCFDIVLWLSHQADEESYRRACSISPFFSLLYHNKKLQRLAQQEAKELWLSFLDLTRLKPQEQAQDRWKVVRELKQYFHSYPLFKEEYDRLAAQEQELAQLEVRQLLDRLEELQEQEEKENALGEAKRLVAQLRKRSGSLPAEEASWYREAAQSALDILQPASDDDKSVLDYRTYLLLGNTAKAEKCKESQHHPWSQEILKKLDDEIEEMFAISAEPIALTASPDLIVDLAAEPAPSGLEYLCSSQRHLLFRESDESIVVVNVSDMTATRYRSPRFKGLAVLDILPDRDVFLLVNQEKKDTVWRATLSGTQSRFTAVFDIYEYFLVPQGAAITGVFMSSTKDNVYYTVSEDGDRLYVVKQSIDLVSSVERIFEVQGNPKGAFRLSCQPDRFVIVTDDSTTVLEGNLVQPRGCSKVGSSQMLNCLGIDVSRSRIYALGDGVVNVLNPNLRAVKQYLRAPSVAHMSCGTLANICVEKSTALMKIKGRYLFYNMETNKFSQKFSLGRLLYTETPSRWYYLESDMTKPVIMIKDITDEVESLLEWQVLLPTVADEGAAATFVQQLEDPDFFSIVPSTDTFEPIPPQIRRDGS